MTTAIRELPPDFVLKKGAHSKTSGEWCAMELVSFLANEPWSDTPACTCPVLGAFIRSWNDSLQDDAERTRLLGPLLPKLIGTKSTPAVEFVRSMLAVDWLVREFTPMWLSLVPSLEPHAKILREAKPIQNWDDVTALQHELSASAAWSAARSAA